jgi:hypothetical protein
MSHASQWFNTVGLLLGMVGVGMILLFGSPQPKFEGRGLQSLKQAAETPKEYLGKSTLGLILVFFGFAFQLVATWLP